MKWFCCQLGAREHYAVPRALLRGGMLGEFFTDLWIPPGTLLHSWKNGRSGRFHPELANARITAPNIAALTFELKASLARENGWKLIRERNEWFQRQALAQLARTKGNGQQTVFAYSYAAREIFQFARARGWRTVLGQIDPGPADEGVISDLHNKCGAEWKPAPVEYWNDWRDECSLADQIVVNSAWSRDALLSEGIPAEKIRVIPVAYEPLQDTKSFQRQYPYRFSSERPLRVLFLGHISLRKGVRQLLDAVKLLEGEHVEFWFVGPTHIVITPDWREHPQCKWFGVVPRVAVDKFYRDADVFVFPTHSDGFGLTQLEAQSWKLPVIASRHCGEVVRDGVNGVLLEEVSGQRMAEALRQFLDKPESLSAMSRESGLPAKFSLENLAADLRA